jgi:energy-coupling factor transport system permease protein
VGDGIIEAQRSRGLDVNKGNILQRTKNYAAILGPLMISSLRIAQQLALAVESKGMSSTARRTTVRPLVFSTLDHYIMLGFAVLLILVISLRLMGYGALNF